MGMDQTIIALRGFNPREDGCVEFEEEQELAYWKKDYDINEWFCSLLGRVLKNGEHVAITLDDIARLYDHAVDEVTKARGEAESDDDWDCTRWERTVDMLGRVLDKSYLERDGWVLFYTADW